MKEVRNRMRNQLDVMKTQLLTKFQYKFTGKLAKSGFPKLPAVSSFELIESEYNEILKDIGIKLKLPREFKWEHLKANRGNRYMIHQINRLRKYRKTNPELFWKIAQSLCKNSISFRASAINHILPGGYYTTPYSKILSTSRKVSNIFRDGKDDIKFFRVYIPKGSEDGRPLGVPTLEGRIALSMLNNCIYLFIEDELLESQHGFIPGKGTMSCGREIINKVIKAKYIYEVDLKQFFPSVQINEISRILGKLKMPKRMIYHIENLNLSLPILPKEEKLDESETKERIIMQQMIKSGETGIEKLQYKPVLEFIEANGIEILYELAACEGCESLEEYVQLQWALFDQYSPSAIGNLRKGVPQGSPTSPLLSILILKDFLSQQPSVSYADDLIFYSNSPFEIKDNPEIGIVIHPEKSKGVKYDGVGYSDLKFLGLIYNGLNNTLSSETRKGRKERISGSIVELFEKYFQESRYSEEINGMTYLDYMSTRNFFGFIQAGLYSGGKHISESHIEVHPKSYAKYHPKGYKEYSSLAILSLMRDLRRVNKSLKTKKAK